jgi:hypothetical protein
MLEKRDVLRLISSSAGTRSAGTTGLALLALCGLAGQSRGQEYCVACTEPSGIYRCVIEDARPGGKQPLQTLCVTAMAKEGGHAACSVKGGTVFDCNGPVKRVSWSAYNDPGVKAGVQAPTKPQASQPATDPSQPPTTVEEMAKRANQKTTEQIKKANEDMGAATRQTWRCIASFFTRCGE